MVETAVDMIATYNNADISFDAGSGDWITGESASVSVNDPDANKFQDRSRNTINW